jgi:hypothetical protein
MYRRNSEFISVKKNREIAFFSTSGREVPQQNLLLWNEFLDIPPSFLGGDPSCERNAARVNG